MILLEANAKLTLSLKVVGRRPDGYHLIEAEMVSLSLADLLELDESGNGFKRRDEVEWVGPPAPVGLAKDSCKDYPQPDLVERAMALCQLRAGCLLRKRIPTGAGLGGGSSDAAAILRYVGLMEPAVAGRLGADVPFCLHGGRAQVSGVGEVVDPRPDEFIGGSYLVVTPRVQVSTAVVYGTWDEMGRPTGDFDNDLEPAALTAYPEIRWWRDLMAAAVGERPRLAGSGGSWFIEGDSQKLRELAAGIRGEIVAARESALVVVTQSVPRILTAVPGS